MTIVSNIGPYIAPKVIGPVTRRVLGLNRFMPAKHLGLMTRYADPTRAMLYRRGEQFLSRTYLPVKPLKGWYPDRLVVISHDYYRNTEWIDKRFISRPWQPHGRPLPGLLRKWGSK